MNDPNNEYFKYYENSNDQPQHFQQPLSGNEIIPQNLLQQTMLEQHMNINPPMPIMPQQTINNYADPPYMDLTRESYFNQYNINQSNVKIPSTINDGLYKPEQSSLIPNITHQSTDSNYIMNESLMTNPLLYNNLNYIYPPNDLKQATNYVPTLEGMVPTYNQPTAQIRKEQDVFQELMSLAAKRPEPSKQPILSSSAVPWADNGYNQPAYSQSMPHEQQKTRKKGFIGQKTVPLKPINFQESFFDLVIVQQPSRARMCGFGDKDRRPITPPPIVKLVITDKYNQVQDPDALDITFLVVMCDSIQGTDPTVDYPFNDQSAVSQVVTFSSSENKSSEHCQSTIKMKNLVGCGIASATKLYDLEGNLGIFFIFQDISLRTEGQFQLKFSLINLESPYSHSLNTNTPSSVLKTVVTDSFMVFTAKKFPGVVRK
ncbi:velvet factor-domain-containing protein [Pilobolus umbonatus]|nr:velvet factor-domain-containing protein [Pilobolus umbonatus]